MREDQTRWIEQLYRDYFGKLILYAEAALRSQSRAQDVVQDTFHEALRHIDALMQHPNPGGWLMVTLKNKLREEARAQQQYTQRCISLHTDLSAEPAGRESELDRWLDEESPSVWERVRAALTPEEFRLLKRLTIDRVGHAEAAKELHISVAASQKRLERIRKKLYKLFPNRGKP